MVFESILRKLNPEESAFDNSSSADATSRVKVSKKVELITLCSDLASAV